MNGELTSPVRSQDQLFSVRMTKKNHLDAIRKLRADISTKKAQASKHGNFKTIPTVQAYIIDKIVAEISEQLFDNFIWECIVTPAQTLWKEYFHNLYELLVVDRADHIGNLIMSYEIIKYHDVLEEPTLEPDPKRDTVIFTLKRLFNDLKREQRNTVSVMGDLQLQMKDALRVAMEVQLDLNSLHRKVRILQGELYMFDEILEIVRRHDASLV